MTPSQRLVKQIVVALVFFLIVGALGFGIYRAFVPSTPAPTPNPTANLAPIQIVFTELIRVANNDYDLVAKVTNPNPDYGSADVQYQLKFFNAANAEISQKSASFHILPGQTRYVVNAPVRFSEPILRVEMSIVRVDWQRLDPLAASGVNLIARNVGYDQVLQPGVFSKVGGSILNDSNFDLGQVEVLVLLFDQTDSLLAVNRTEIRTFLAKTSRGFEVTWFTPFVGQVSRIEVEAHTNVFENSNFLRQYERQERFQQFY